MSTKTKSRYLVLLVGMLMQLCAGIIYMWSIFMKPVMKHLSWNEADAKITASIMLSAFVLGIVVGGRLQDKSGPKPIAAAGSIMLGLGMVLSAFVPASTPWLIYITYGVISGMGVGFIYTTTVSVVQKWFPDKRGLATGMLVGAFGFSLVLFSKITADLLEPDVLGVKNTFLLFGIMFLAVCFVCSMFLSNPEHVVHSGGAAANLAAPAKKQFTTLEMLKTVNFYLLAFSMFCVLSAYFILNPVFKILGEDRGLTPDMATLAVMVTGIASASGRIITSACSDLFGRKPVLMAIAAITMIFALIMIVAQGVWFIVCIAVIAFCFGGSASVYAATTADIFGTKNMGLNYGCVMVGFGTSAIAFQMISNALLKHGGYTPSFILAASACVLALLLILFLKVPKKVK